MCEAQYIYLNDSFIQFGVHIEIESLHLVCPDFCWLRCLDVWKVQRRVRWRSRGSDGGVGVLTPSTPSRYPHSPANRALLVTIALETFLPFTGNLSRAKIWIVDNR